MRASTSISTPLGNARDITLRALDVLRDADLLVAEDTRSLRRLMNIHGVPLAGRRILAYHDHSGDRDRKAVLEALAQNASVAYASEAGTPLVADPGFALVRTVIGEGHRVLPVPGPSAFDRCLDRGRSAMRPVCVCGIPAFAAQRAKAVSGKARRCARHAHSI